MDKTSHKTQMLEVQNAADEIGPFPQFSNGGDLRLGMFKKE
jgi:hypothetical protein